MKKMLIILGVVLLAIIVLYINYPKGDFSYGNYVSKQLIEKGITSTYYEVSPNGLQTGMRYTIKENVFEIRCVDETKFTLLLDNQNEVVVENVTYVKELDIRGSKLKMLENLLGKISTLELYNIVDSNGNVSKFEILRIEDNLYILDSKLYTIDEIRLIASK